MLTNILILSLQLLGTNSFPYGATDEFGGWSSNICQSVQMTYTAPTDTVVTVEYTWTVPGPVCNSSGCWGMRWTTLNCGGLTNGSYNGMGAYPTAYPVPRGFYTNAVETNTITLPVPNNDLWFFRLRKRS